VVRLGDGIAIIHRDITERKRAEEAMRLSHEQFLTVLNSIDATIYVADMGTHEILFMNRNMIDSFGRDLTGKICWEVFRGESGQCPHCTNGRLIDENGKPTGLYVWNDQNPITGKWYINHDRAIEWIDGRIVRLQIATDITDLKQMEEKLREAQKMESIGTLAGGIAHDFNNILSPIIGISELLMEDLSPDSLEYENAKEIFVAGKRGGDLVQQILAFSRRSENIRMAVRPQQILKEVLKLCRSTIPVNIDITQDIQKDCGAVLANPTQLHQIAMNLITNAFHAVEETGGEISIALKEMELDQNAVVGSDIQPGHYALLSITDNGSGIDPAIMNKIFDPYFTTKKKGKGTGLGLAVVYGIVKEHSGDIRVHSEPGKGTTFTVYLPIIDNHSEIIPVTAPEKNESAGERILLVDDEPSIVRLSKQMLEKIGYHVTTRNSSVDALAAFKANPGAYDLVITDMNMPNITGTQLAKELLLIRPDIPIIICTGFSERINEENIKGYGIKGLLMKPVVKSEMAGMVRKVLNEAGKPSPVHISESETDG
jgi:signal transduction histidine kinase/ActR/RegA family two-component response regulator